jgi:hypothetical protein
VRAPPSAPELLDELQSPDACLHAERDLHGGEPEQADDDRRRKRREHEDDDARRETRRRLRRPTVRDDAEVEEEGVVDAFDALTSRSSGHATRVTTRGATARSMLRNNA